MELTTVTLPVTALAPLGTPPWPHTVKVRGVLALSLPDSPIPLRVSSTRAGVRAWYVSPPAAGLK